MMCHGCESSLPEGRVPEERVPEGLGLHGVIAWDVDLTLIGHPASPWMHDFIRRTPQIRHLVVSFRAHGAELSVWDDLEGVPGAAARSCFAALHTIDHDLAARFQRLARHRRAGLYAGPPCPDEMRYLTWKGRICAEAGAGVLIDDMTEHVRLGCEAHGVALLHPDAFLGSS